MGSFSEQGNEPLTSTKGRKCLDQNCSCSLLRRNTCQWTAVIISGFAAAFSDSGWQERERGGGEGERDSCQMRRRIVLA